MTTNAYGDLPIIYLIQKKQTKITKPLLTASFTSATPAVHADRLTNLSLLGSDLHLAAITLARLEKNALTTCIRKSEGF